MVFKINIAEKNGKTYHLEAEAQELLEKSLHDKIEGTDVSNELGGYEFEITGGSDKEGFPMRTDVEGVARRRIFLTNGVVGTKLNRKGVRLRKSIAGNTVSQLTSQINLKVIKAGNTSLDEIFGKTKKEEKAEESKE